MGDLERRLRRLERINLALIAVAGLACLMAARGDATFDRITCREVSIVSEKGKRCGGFGVLGDDEAATLDMGTAKGGGIYMMAAGDGGEMVLSHPTSKASFSVMFDEKGVPNVVVEGKGGERPMETPKGAIKPFR